MEAIKQNIESLNTTQHIICLGVFGLLMSIITQNGWIFVLFSSLVYIGHCIVLHLAKQKTQYDSTFLLTVVDTILWAIYKVKSYREGEATPSNKLDCVKDSVPEQEMKTIVSYILRDFVNSWYREITDSDLFLIDVQKMLEKASNDSLDRLGSLDKFVIITDFAKLFQLHFGDFQAAVHTLQQQPKYRRKRDRGSEFKKMKNVEDAFKSLGLNHHALENREQEMQYLRCITDIMIKLLFSNDVHNCHSAKELLVDILSCQVMISLVDLICQPYWLHTILILLLSDEELASIDEDSSTKNKPTTTAVTSFTSASIQHTSELQPNVENKRPMLQTELNIYHSSSSERLPPIGASCSTESPLMLRVHQDELEEMSTDQTVKRKDSVLSTTHQQQFELSLDSQSHGSLLSTVPDDMVSIASSQTTGESHNMLDGNDGQPKKIFTNIEITGSESAKEAGGSGQYQLYVIQYCAWYETRSCTWEQREKLHVKRRYREFVALHDRLEEVTNLKPHMNGIKGPQRFGMFPGARIDGAKIEKRRLFLTEYLKILLSRPAVCNSQAMREFLAYEGDAQIAFVKSAPDNLPRFDKLFFSTVGKLSNALSFLTDALPSLPDPHDVPPPEELQKRKQEFEKKACTEWDDPDTLTISFAGQDHQQYDFSSSMYTYLESCRGTQHEERCVAIREAMEEEEEEQEHGAEEQAKGEKRVEEDVINEECAAEKFYDPHEYTEVEYTEGEEEELIEEKQDDKKNQKLTHKTNTAAWSSSTPLVSVLLELALQSVHDMDTWLHHERTVHIAIITLATFLEAFIRREVDSVTTRQHCTYYLRLLHSLLWPDGELDRTPIRVPSEKQKQATKQQAKQCLAKFFPGWLPYVIGHSEFAHSVDAVMEAIDHDQINRQFTYKMLDMLLEHIFPELDSLQIRQQLIENSAIFSEDKDKTKSEIGHL